MASISSHVMADKWKEISETCTEIETRDTERTQHTQGRRSAAFRFWYVRLHTNLFKQWLTTLASD